MFKTKVKQQNLNGPRPAKSASSAEPNILSRVKKMKRAAVYITLTVFITHVTCVRYHSYTGEKISDPEEKRLAAAGVLRWCSVDVAPCSPKDYRRINGSCNNLHRPSRGASLTPYRRLLKPVFAVGNLRG